MLTWSFSFLAAARLRQDLSLTEALAARFLPVALGPAGLLLGRRPRRLPREVWPRLLAMGLLGVPAYNVFFLHGLKTVPSGTAALIIPLNPLFPAALARIALGEPFGLRRMAGPPLALGGGFPGLPLRNAKPGRRADF